MRHDGPMFTAMLHEFDRAARLLGLEPGIWEILTHPKRQIIVSCPVLMDVTDQSKCSPATACNTA